MHVLVAMALTLMMAAPAVMMIPSLQLSVAMIRTQVSAQVDRLSTLWAPVASGLC
jgi:hypothetical protein